MISLLQMPLPLTVRHNREPDACDKLSQDEIEALILEVIKTYQEAEVTKDPFMSPLLAPDDLLIDLPTAHIIVSDKSCLRLNMGMVSCVFKPHKPPVFMNTLG